MNARELTDLIKQYQQHSHLHEHLAFYEQLPTIEQSIEYAALARRPDGKRHSHQSRLRRETLESVRAQLLDNRLELERCESFAEIIGLVRGCAVPGFGELACYDTALRLAVRLRKLPDAVYLHAGTRKGAAALGLDVAREAIPVTELPPPLQLLEAYQVEDFLCIYKAAFSRLSMDHQPAVHNC